MTTRLMKLEQAVRAYVEPGMHLHFSSLPSRSNGAIRELGRVFRGLDPRFVLSTTGFHSSAHLLALLRLGRRYIACFFGDNSPLPRPNALYETLRREGAELEAWSLLSYVESLRAGAMGHEWALTRSLKGSTLGERLAAQGRYAEVPAPEGGGSLGLVAAMRPDLTFVHAPAGDEEGNVLFSAPFSEGLWGALGARKGVIVTVERLVSAREIAGFPDSMRLPRHKVLAVCEEPFGTHPQPLLVPSRFDAPGLRDDFEHYELWREMTRDPELFRKFEREVLEAADGQGAYRAFVGEARLESLRASSALREPPPALGDEQVGAGEALVLVAARLIAKRVREKGFRTILAGIGQGFLAAKIAHGLLAAEGVEVKVVVETGLEGIDCSAEGEEFLLGYRNMARAERLSSVEDVLGVQVCGADNRCLGVLGAAEVDGEGHINSTLSMEGRLLVGSGGANDIASCADEIIVVSPCHPQRLVERVAHVTSPGRSVSAVATDRGVLLREDGSWRLSEAPEPVSEAVEEVRAACPWTLDVSSPEPMPVFTKFEREAVRALDPRGISWKRK